MREDLESLREAARLMRERAAKATAGPWEHGGNDGLVWPPRIGDPVSGSTETEDADHIASWHPAVAVAVADWLDIGANPYACVDRWPMFRVARAYLGDQP